MDSYFKLIKQNENNLPIALEYFENEYEQAKAEIVVKGKLTDVISLLSSNFEKRFAQLQELEAILKHFEIKLNQKKSETYKKYLENYQRALSNSDIRAYIDGVPEVVALQQIINEIVLVRNKFISLSKGFDTANYQLSNLSKLYASGCDSVII